MLKTESPPVIGRAPHFWGFAVLASVSDAVNTSSGKESRSDRPGGRPLPRLEPHRVTDPYGPEEACALAPCQVRRVWWAWRRRLMTAAEPAPAANSPMIPAAP